MDGVMAIAAGDAHSLALKTDGSLWGFGQNTFGQLGVGDDDQRSAPVKVMDCVRAIAAGEGHSLIVEADGTLWGTGHNNNSQLDDDSTRNHRSEEHTSELQSLMPI